MILELEKPRITEIQVRMDCNGCVQKIKKALHGINGIYEIYIDFPNQKLTIIGWADPEKIVKARKKTRKIATICTHTEQPDPAAQQAPPTEQAPEGNTPAPELTNPPPPENPTQEAALPPEPPKDPPSSPPPPENTQPQATPPPAPAESNPGQPSQPTGPDDVEEVHVIHHHPSDYGYRYAYGAGLRGPWNKYQNSRGLQFQHEQTPASVCVTHSYSAYKPSPYVTEYQYSRSLSQTKPSPFLVEHEHTRSPPQYVYYSRMERYNEDYYQSSSNGIITSIFSDKHPNACRIM